MKRVFLTVIILLGFVTGIQAQDTGFLNKENVTILLNEKYGEYERNVFDIIVPKEKSPHGLVMFIHGGGFRHGDKQDLYTRKEDVQYFIDHNVAVATTNYRFFNSNDSLGVKLCLNDIQRAIQYIRFNARKYNIDKSEIACYGISAGAGSSLYFAFHDDMAIPGDTTLLGESTRIKCAGAISTQSTYNLFRWEQIIPGMQLVLALKRKTFYNAAANFYGYPSCNSMKNQRKAIAESLDLLDMIDHQDSPVYLMNLLKAQFPVDNNIIQHHKKHAVVLSEKLNKHGVKNYLFTEQNAGKDMEYPVRQFLVDNLK